MTGKIKLLILASFLALAGTPLLYVGGKNDDAGIIVAGMIIFCLGMGMVLALKLFSKPKSGNPPPVGGKKT